MILIALGPVGRKEVSILSLQTYGEVMVNGSMDQRDGGCASSWFSSIAKPNVASGFATQQSLLLSLFVGGGRIALFALFGYFE